MAVLFATLLWLFYLALEPYVRRLRPWTLISWTRLLDGGVRDAVVGRDVLIGMTWGALFAPLFLVLVRSLPRWLSQADPVPGKALLTGLLGLRPLLGFLFECLISTTFLGLGALLLFLILRLVTRRDVLAAALIVGILLASAVSGGEASLWFVLPMEIALFGSFLVLLLRIGVLSAIAGLFVFDVLSAVLGRCRGLAPAHPHGDPRLPGRARRLDRPAALDRLGGRLPPLSPPDPRLLGGATPSGPRAQSAGPPASIASRSSRSPRYSHRCRATGRLPFRHRKSWTSRRRKASPWRRRASARKRVICSLPIN
jgi:hypothetical protein